MTPNSTAQDALHTELAALRSRVDELEQVERALRDDLHRAQRIAVAAPYLLCVHDLAERRNVYENRALAAELGYAGDEASRLGADPLAALLHPDDLAHAPEHLARVAQNGHWSGVLTVRRPDESHWMGQTSAFLMSDGAGVPTGMAALFRDVTSRLETEKERASVQEQMIEAQQATLRELGTPLIPIADEVIVIPLIGAIDPTRAQQILETLLDGITTRGASVAILDITGVTR